MSDEEIRLAAITVAHNVVFNRPNPQTFLGERTAVEEQVVKIADFIVKYIKGEN